MMNKLFAAFVSLLGILGFSSCRNRDRFATAVNDKSLLWEISGKGLNAPSYFFGTMHLMCAEDVILSATMETLIKKVDRIYLEVDLDNASELMSGILEMRRSNGITLKSALGERDYLKVKAFFERHQPAIPFSLIEEQPPLMITSTFYELLLPCEQKNGMEMKIVEQAYKEKKETKGLETVAFQASVFDSIPYNVQAQDLVSSIDSIEKSRTAINEMIRAYKIQDVEKLYSLSIHEQNGIGQYMELLLYKRNHDWVTQFSGIAENGSTLFAVGAGHLGGDKGVLQLLKNSGYSVRAIAN